MFNKKTVQWILGGALLLAFQASGQNAIRNGGFDQNTPGVSSCGGIHQWSNYGGVQWESRWNNDGDSWWVDLTGCGWGNGHAIEQTVLVEPYQLYTLSFDLGCWNGQYFTNGGVNVYIDGALIGHYTHTDFTGNVLNWREFEYCFNTEWRNRLTIRFEGAGEATPATPGYPATNSNYVGVIGLDNVALEKSDGRIDRQNGCAPTVLSHHSANGTAYWFKDGQLIAVNENPVQAPGPGVYRLVYVTDCGVVESEVTLSDCDKTCQPGDFHILPPPFSERLCAGMDLIFHGYPLGTQPLLYSWDFGDGHVFPFGAPGTMYHTFDTPGIYTICMTVTPDIDYVPLCEPYTVCHTIEVLDCTDWPVHHEYGDALPYDPGDGDQRSMSLNGQPEVSVFPNPATDKVTVSGLAGEPSELVLYSISGTVVFKRTLEAWQTETEFSLKELEAGVYLLKINGQIYSGEVRLVKQ